jgi:hypothetical protein
VSEFPLTAEDRRRGAAESAETAQRIKESLGQSLRFLGVLCGAPATILGGESGFPSKSNQRLTECPNDYLF